MINKSYKNNQTGEIVKIIDIYENIAITDNKQKLDAKRLLDNRFYTEYIDPKNFFNDETTYSTFAQKINSIDLSKVPEESNYQNGVEIKMQGIDSSFIPESTDSVIIQSDIEEEKKELMRKYGIKQDTTALQKQNEAFSRILKENGEEEVMNQNPITKIVENFESEEVNKVNQVSSSSSKIEDPIITMFKNVKRKEEFSINLTVDGLLPRFDFIEMMEDSYETSIIEFLAEEMCQKILKDPSLIKNKIIEEIKNKVYPNKKVETKVSQKTKTTTRRKTNNSEPKDSNKKAEIVDENK